MHRAPTPECRGAIQDILLQFDENEDSTLNRVVRSEFALVLLYRLRIRLCRDWRRGKSWFLARDRLGQRLIVPGDPEPRMTISALLLFSAAARARSASLR